MKASLIKRFRKEYATFKKDACGKRFLHLYRRSRKLPPIVRVGLGAAGLVLALGGLALGFIPGVPGIVFGVAGMALVAAQFKFIAVGLDKSEVTTRNFATDLKSAFSYPSLPRKSSRHAVKKRTRSTHKTGHAVAT